MWRNHNTQGYTDFVMAMTVENFLRTVDGLGALEFVLSLSIDEKARPACRAVPIPSRPLPVAGGS
jgi:hypothetical protein